VLQKEEKREERERVIFPTKKLEAKMIIEEKIQPRVAAGREESREFEEEDELEIPAFIRRKMKK
jgi:hypothetical protein